MFTKNKTLSTVLVSLSLAMILSVSALADKQRDTEGKYVPVEQIIDQNSPKNKQIDWENGIVTVTGAGAPPDQGNIAQKRLMAQRSAKADAYRQLLEVINGVKVNSETIVKDFVTESDSIKIKVDGLIRGAEQSGDTRYLSDGSVELDLQLKIFGSDDSLASVVLPAKKQKSLAESSKLKPAENVSEDLTGVIIDCRGLKLEPAMSPAIFDQDGGQVYIGNLKIDPDYVINEGIVAYEYSLTEAKKNKRAGSNPLVIKAVKSEGKFKSDIVISNQDAQLLLGIEIKTKILSETKVIFLL